MPTLASCALAISCAALAVRSGGMSRSVLGGAPPLRLFPPLLLTRLALHALTYTGASTPDYCPSTNCTQLPFTFITHPCRHSSEDPYALNNSWCQPSAGLPPPLAVESPSTSTAPNVFLNMCPKGGLLGSGTATGPPIPCPAGTFNAKEKQTLATDCTPCANGTYGGKQAWSFPSCENSCPTGRCALIGSAVCAPRVSLHSL
jgi:hypothetical protein